MTIELDNDAALDLLRLLDAQRQQAVKCAEYENAAKARDLIETICEQAERIGLSVTAIQ